MTVRVVTDSSAVVPSPWIADVPLRVIPLDVAWPDGSQDRGDLPYERIAQRLRDEPVPPTTGAPSPGSFVALINEVLLSSDGLLIVCPASDLSTTYQSAILGAREVGDERVRVLDSRTAAAGQGLVASEAARLAAHGAGLEEVAARASHVAGRVQIWATLAQLEFVRRSGRLPAIAAVGAGALGLQPVVRYAGGSPAPVAVVRSTRAGAERLLRAWQRSIAGDVELHATAFHSARREEAEWLRERIVDRVPAARAGVVEVSASLAAHTGPGLLGLAWFWDN